MIAKKFGLLIVVEREGRVPNLGTIFRCRCACGNIVTVPHSNLLTGNTKSCGCLKRQKNDLPFAGASRLREYQIWKLMIIRCSDELDRAYHQYGGRGIIVCDRWKSSFANFLTDMGRRPSPKHTLDRIDCNGNYEPSNCRWADWHTQQNNRRNNRHIEYQGQTRTLSEWARQLSLPVTTLNNRLKLGWTVEKAFTTHGLSGVGRNADRQKLRPVG